MKLIMLDSDVFVDPAEVVSVEHDTTYKFGGGAPSDPCMIKDFDGTKIILRNGRKVFIDRMMPSEVIEKLKAASTNQIDTSDSLSEDASKKQTLKEVFDPIFGKK